MAHTDSQCGYLFIFIVLTSESTQLIFTYYSFLHDFLYFIFYIQDVLNALRNRTWEFEGTILLAMFHAVIISGQYV